MYRRKKLTRTLSTAVSRPLRKKMLTRNMSTVPSHRAMGRLNRSGATKYNKFVEIDTSDDPKSHAAATKLAARARGYLTRKHVYGTRYILHERSKQNKMYISSSLSEMERLHSLTDKFNQLKLLTDNRDFSDILTKVFRMFESHGKTKAELLRITKELEFHPGIGRNVKSIMLRKSAERVAACERIMGHISGYCEEMQTSAYSIEAERLADTLKTLKEVSGVREERNKAMESETKDCFDEFIHIYKRAEATICEVGDLQLDRLYDENSDYDPMGFMFLDGMQSKNYFANVHPTIDLAISHVRAAVRAASSFEKALSIEHENHVIWLNNVLMRREEIDRRRWIAEERVKRQVENSHKLFVALSRRWFEDGKKRLVEINEARARALDRARVERERNKQKELDRLRDSPFAAARVGVSLQRMRELLEDESLRQKNQECRVFRIDDREYESGDRLLHNACWAGHVHLVKFFVDECGANVHQVSDPLARLTPLHVASRAGEEDVAMFLLKSGASLEAQDASGDSALHWAARKNNFKVVKALVSHLPRVSPVRLRRARSSRRGDPAAIPRLRRLHDYVTLKNDHKHTAKGVTKSKAIREYLGALEKDTWSALSSLLAIEQKKRLVMGTKY